MIKDKLEALSAALACFLFHLTMATGIFITIYTVFYTKHWYIAVVYYIWALYIDKETPYRGGRKLQWVCNLPLYKYARNYFPVKLHLVPGFATDPKRNYLCCTFPHGYISLGGLLGFITNTYNANQLFKHHTIYAATLRSLFAIPVAREYTLSLGLCSASSESLGYLLNRPEGGNAVGLVVGGTTEMFYFNDGQYNLTLKNRKGFIKLALKCGAPLIPVFAFGETSLFKQKVFPEGSLGRYLINCSKRIFGYPFLMAYGKGLFQDKFGFIPFKHPLNVVVGMPIDVIKKENPTQEDIDMLHQTFIGRLVNLFEEYKYQFEKDPENSELILS